MQRPDDRTALPSPHSSKVPSWSCRPIALGARITCCSPAVLATCREFRWGQPPIKPARLDELGPVLAPRLRLPVCPLRLSAPRLPGQTRRFRPALLPPKGQCPVLHGLSARQGRRAGGGHSGEGQTDPPSRPSAPLGSWGHVDRQQICLALKGPARQIADDRMRQV